MIIVCGRESKDIPVKIPLIFGRPLFRRNPYFHIAGSQLATSNVVVWRKSLDDCSDYQRSKLMLTYVHAAP
jgi:hypothetical protein